MARRLGILKDDHLDTVAYRFHRSQRLRVAMCKTLRAISGVLVCSGARSGEALEVEIVATLRP